ncbi:MAG: MBG domain-containing protein, partial [Clostridia bacterium]|nr:MBG domain-containing protein [Clostridia bacterium]
MSTKRYRLISTLSAAIIVVAVLLCFCFISLDNIGDVFAFTTSNIASGAVDVGDILLEGYADRTDGKVFNGEAMQSLYAKLTGDAAKDTIDDVDALGTQTAAQIYAKNGNKDIVLTMDGQKWTVTHLTKDRSGNTIATLWLATSSETHKWNTWSANTPTAAYPSSMYSSSYIRANALNGGNGDSSGYIASNGATTLTPITQSATHKYAKLTMPSVKGSLTDFIVTPAQVAYQETENQNDGGTIGGVGYTLPNEAYGTPSGTVKWYNANMNYSTKNGYAEWKDDYIWLPSMTETGYSATYTGIWGLSINQRSNSTNSWARSGYYYDALGAYMLDSAGNSCSNTRVTNNYVVRPALHLNLDLAAERSGGVALVEPTDVTVEYKGSALTLDDVAAEQKSWFKPEQLSITFDSVIKDTGTYKVKAEIKPEIGLTFAGTPDTSAGESDTVRYFNFTVTKKKIGIKAELDSGGLPIVTLKNAGDVCTGDTPENGRAPSFGFTYTSSGGVTSDTLPTAVGTYTATAKMTNDCNYEIDTANSTLSVTFKIDKKSIDKPALSGQVTKLYSGVAQSFTLQGVTADVSLTLPDGVTYADGALNATNAGTYKIRVALADNGAATQWADGTSSAYELTVTITKRPLNITISVDTSSWTWKVGDTPTVTIVGDSLASDTTELHIYYCKNGSSVKYDLDAYKVITGKTRTIKMPVLDQGDYYIGVELFGDKQGNSNYEILAGTVTQTFKVLGNDITFTDA